MKLKKMMKRAALIVTGIVLAVSIRPAIPVQAAQAVEDCVLFASGDGDSIYVDAGHINMNGDIVTNGKFTTTLENPGINGNIYENQQNSIPDYKDAIQSQYYNGEVNLVEADYSPEDVNENISKAMKVEGNFTSTDKNIAFNGGALMTKGDIIIDGGSFSCSDGVIYSQDGNIHIATDNFSASALFYAPNGNVYIECGNINMNGCIVAQSIEIVSSGGANLNKNQELMKKFGQTIQADEALNDTEDNNHVDRKDTTSQQQSDIGNTSTQNEQQSTGNNAQGSAQEHTAIQQNNTNVQQNMDATNNQGQQNSNNQSNNNAQGNTSSQQSGEASTNNNSSAAESTAEEVVQFEDISKYELKNPIDLFILIYQICTGQKGIVIFDID